MEIKVVTLNEDGSVAFEGSFGPNEVKFVLEVGTNFLLANGASPFVQESDEDASDEFVEVPEEYHSLDDDEDSPTRH